MTSSAGPPHAEAGTRTPGRGRPTLEQVAARAGVSRATVSRVVNKAASVDPRLADRVTRAVEELRYVPNLAARALMTRRTDTVVLVAAESSTRFFADPFFAAVVRGVSQELARAGLHLVLSVAQDREDVDRVEGFVQGGHVDGALVLSEHDHLDTAGRLRAAGVPWWWAAGRSGRTWTSAMSTTTTAGAGSWPRSGCWPSGGRTSARSRVPAT